MSDLSWPTFADGSTTLTADHLNAVPTAVNSKSDDDHTHDDLVDSQVVSLSDKRWSGQWRLAVAGEALVAADFGCPVYVKNYSGSPRVYKWLAGSGFSDNDSYRPCGLVLDHDDYDLDSGFSAGDTLVVSVGDGVFRHDSLAFVASDLGVPLYLSETGGWTTTRPTATGSWAFEVGELIAVTQKLVQVTWRSPGTRNS
jgi:hypothetical protein